MDDPPRDTRPPTPIGTLAQIVRDAFTALGRELAAWKPSTERAGFATQAMLSVALAVALAYALHLSNTWWAAISGFAVMQTSFAASAQRGVHRILGTVLGALLGAIVGPLIGDLPWVFVPVLGVIGGVSVYQALGSEAGYAWVLGAATALMVTFEAHLLGSASATASFAMLRVAEVVVGTLACVLVSGAFHMGEAVLGGAVRPPRRRRATPSDSAAVARRGPRRAQAARVAERGVDRDTRGADLHPEAARLRAGDGDGGRRC